MIVIGAGISGLAAAHHLRSIAPAAEIVVLERSDRVGGMVQTETVDGRVTELGPEGFVSNRPEALDLVDQVGLGAELITGGPAPRQTFIARGGRLLPLPYGVMNPDRTAAADLLRSPLLSLRGRLRLMAEPLIPRRRAGDAPQPSAPQPRSVRLLHPLRTRFATRWGESGGSSDGRGDESVAAFVRRRFGDEMLTELVDPLLGGIHGSSTDDLSAEMLIPALRRIERDGGSVALAALRRRRGRRAADATGDTDQPLPPLVSLQRGMGSLTDALGAELGASIRLGVGVRAIDPVAGHRGHDVDATAPDQSTWRITCEDGSILDADAVIMATPSAVTARLLAPLAADTARAVAAMPWGSSTTVSLTWAPGDVSLEMGTGYLVPAAEGGVVAACTFTTAKWHHRSADGSTMVRCFMRGDDLGTMSDGELIAAARDELRRRVGVTATPVDASVRRVPVALPVMRVGHRDAVRAIHDGIAHLDGLALAGGGLEGAGLPACIRSGRLAAERAAAALPHASGVVGSSAFAVG